MSTHLVGELKRLREHAFVTPDQAGDGSQECCCIFAPLLFLLCENSVSAIVLPLVPRLKPSLQSDARHFSFKACFLLSVQIQNVPEKHTRTPRETEAEMPLQLLSSLTLINTWRKYSGITL